MEEEVEVESFGIEWVGNDQEEVHQEIVTEENSEDTEDEEEEYLVGEEIIPTTEINTIPNSLDHIAAENLIYMAHDGNVTNMGDLIEEQVEQVENADYNEQQFFECQVTEEVITDDWVQQQGEERVEIPAGQLCQSITETHIEEIDVPLPTDQDEYTSSRPYPCDFCSRRFRKKANLMNHMVAHQNDRPHVCNLCGARYIRRCDLLNHLKIHAYVPDDEAEEENVYFTEQEKPKKRPGNVKETSSNNKRLRSTTKVQKTKKIKIEPNDDKFDEDDNINLLTSQNTQKQNNFDEMQNIERYPITDHRKPFVCQHCGVGFAREKALASHSRMHGGDSPFECDACGEMFWDPALLREHQKLHHQLQGTDSEFEPENEGNDNDDTESETDSKFGEFYCDICGMSFHRHDLLRRHLRSHRIKKETIDDDSDGHCCNVCGENFSEALDLLAHAEIHARFQPLKCMLCGETFVEETAIKSHLNINHAHEMTANSCRLCGKLCRDGRTLIKHAWDHSREKNHSCSKCGKTFHNKARLKRHMVSHRNKAVQCDVCGDEFPDGRSLMNHRHSHSNVTGRQFPCRECGKTFGSRSSQQIHIRIHTGERPYGCKYCWKAFADGGTLRKHERIHTGEKPYACSVCPRAFNQRVVLREHIRSHHSSPDTKRGTTMTPYYCTVCSELFVSSMELIKHLIQHSDTNTALKRQPLTGPRKYKRRRKLKPHELERLKAQKIKTGDYDYSDDEIYIPNDNDHDEEQISDSDHNLSSKFSRMRSTTTTNVIPKRKTNNERNKFAVKNNNENDNFEAMLQNLTLPNIDNIPLTASKPSAAKTVSKKKTKNETLLLQQQSSRPKMIHTQKTRIAIEDGKRKTKTFITRTTAAAALNESQQQQNERNRPRTKNVNYHVLVHDKLPNATFPNEIGGNSNNLLNIKQEKFLQTTQQQYLDLQEPESELNFAYELPRKSLEKYNSDIVNDLEEILRSPIKGTSIMMDDCSNNFDNGIEESPPTATTTISLRPRRNLRQKFSFKIGQTALTTKPEKKSIRKLSNNNKINNNNKNKWSKNVQQKQEQDELSKQDNHNKLSDEYPIMVKQEMEEIITDEIFRCEMCSAVFNDRSQLLVHVPIHI